MSQIIVSSDKNRADYNRAVEQLAIVAGMPTEALKGAANIMPGILRLRKPLDPGRSQYSLSPRKGVDPLVDGSILLDQNDGFVVTGIGVRISRASFAEGNLSNHGNYPMLTWPDPAYFTGNGTNVGSEYNGLLTLVNGTLSVSVQNLVVLDSILVSELMKSPESPYSAATPRRDQQFDGERGLFSLTPQLVLDASSDNQITITLGNGAKANIDGAISTGTTDSGVRNILNVILMGFKVKNYANLNARGVQCATF
jgi:hypothetical protein